MRHPLKKLKKRKHLIASALLILTGVIYSIQGLSFFVKNKNGSSTQIFLNDLKKEPSSSLGTFNSASPNSHFLSSNVKNINLISGTKKHYHQKSLSQESLKDSHPQMKLVIYDMVEKEKDDSSAYSSETKNDNNITNKSSVKKLSFKNKTPWDLPAPAAFLKNAGENAQETWHSFLNERFDKTEKNSLVLEIPKRSNSSGLVGQNSITPKRLSPTKFEPRFVTWQLKDQCAPSSSSSLEVKAGHGVLVGFIVKTFNTNQILLKQSFIGTKPNDVSGCLIYKETLDRFLPPDVSDIDFNGFISITAFIDGPQELGEEVWSNLIRPKKLSLGEPGKMSELGPASFELSWGDEASDPDILGYRIYLGRTSGVYSLIFDTKSTKKEFKITGVARGNWYISITHYTKDKESTKSGEFYYEENDEANK